VPFLTVPPGTVPLRLDRFLALQVANCSRRTAQRVIAAGLVEVNGRRARKAAVVHAGDDVSIPDQLGVEPALQPNAELRIPVLYEDDVLLAVDKPAGIPSHALRAEETSTVANFLLARFPKLAGVGPRRLEPGLVHRLDTDTSGVLLVARDAATFAALRRQFSQRQVDKLYLALVAGELRQPGEIHLPIAHAPHNRRKMRVAALGTRGARRADTAYRPIERLAHHTLVEVRIRTGVMHQIRVQIDSPLPADFTAYLENLRQKVGMGTNAPMIQSPNDPITQSPDDSITR
jgi:23S rRNA pseudouridine1911/1915/1917 synthase